MKELLTIPAIAVVVLGFVLQLQDIAESTSDKAVSYAEDMNSAMDCAMAGIPISRCSPEITKTSFKEEAKEAIELLNSTEIEYNATNQEEA